MRLRVVNTTDPAAAIELLRAVEPHAVDGARAEEMAFGCALLDVIEEGQRVGAVAVEIEGERATITAAASRGVATWRELQMIEGQLKRMGIKRLGMFTKRPGLVRQLARRGYQPLRPWGTGFALELEKEL